MASIFSEVGATIADVMNARSDAKTQEAIANAQINASASQQNTALAIAANNQNSMKFIVIAAVILVIGYQLAKRA